MSDNLLERYQLMQLQKSVESRNGKKIKLRWDSPAAVRRSLAKINNLVVNGELPAKSANSIYFSANMILKALELENKDKKKG